MGNCLLIIYFFMFLFNLVLFLFIFISFLNFLYSFNLFLIFFIFISFQNVCISLMSWPNLLTCQIWMTYFYPQSIQLHPFINILNPRSNTRIYIHLWECLKFLVLYTSQKHSQMRGSNICEWELLLISELRIFIADININFGDSQTNIRE